MFSEINGRVNKSVGRNKRPGNDKRRTLLLLLTFQYIRLTVLHREIQRLFFQIQPPQGTTEDLGVSVTSHMLSKNPTFWAVAPSKCKRYSDLQAHCV